MRGCGVLEAKGRVLRRKDCWAMSSAAEKPSKIELKSVLDQVMA
jgi:hypothetical protein